MTIEEKNSVLRDDCLKTFCGYEDEEFCEFLYDVDYDTTWEQVPTSELVIDTDCELYKPEHFAATTADTANALVEDTLAHTQLTMRMYYSDYLVGDSAIKSLQDRAQISGKGLDKLSRADYAYVLNVLLRNQTSQSKAMIRCGKVRFVASGDEKDYSIMRMSDLVSETYEFCNRQFGGTEFIGGHFMHTLTTARWNLPNMTGKLLDVYTMAAKAHGRNGVDDLTPAIQFASSDTGVGSVKLSAMLVGGTFPIYIGSAVDINHRYGVTIENDYVKALDELYASYRARVQKLADLTTIELSYPVNALARLAKKYHLPRKEAAEVVNNYRMIYGDDPATAHDVYLGLQEIIYLNSTNQKRAVTPTRRVTFEEDVAKCLTMRLSTWDDYDLAEGVEL